MILPISFDDVSYFRNEFRGDLIVTSGVLYYFPHTRVKYERTSDQIAGRDASGMVGDVGGLIVPFLAFVPWAFEIANVGIRSGKFFRRNLAPSINKPRIRNDGLWMGIRDDRTVRAVLDAYVEDQRHTGLDFSDDAVPKPLRFTPETVSNVRLGSKLRFDTEYDSHDFRISPFRRRLLRRALVEGGFIN